MQKILYEAEQHFWILRSQTSPIENHPQMADKKGKLIGISQQQKSKKLCYWLD
ncbi:hypothetical protein [Erwinia tracheiphila]|uniref:hypothetical protein n=1 Tax=Erwinia tracheiphila TaxID=65700 RepID=UPI0003A8433E|nr:hypothetical protein [Erwinia tracheiphila]